MIPSNDSCPVCSDYGPVPCACLKDADPAAVTKGFEAFVAEWRRVGMPGEPRLEGGHAAVSVSRWGFRVVYRTETAVRVLADFPASEEASDETEELVCEAFAIDDAQHGTCVHSRPLRDGEDPGLDALVTYTIMDDDVCLAKGVSADDACEVMAEHGGHASILDDRDGSVVVADTDGSMATLAALPARLEDHEHGARR